MSSYNLKFNAYKIRKLLDLNPFSLYSIPTINLRKFILCIIYLSTRFNKFFINKYGYIENFTNFKVRSLYQM